MPAKGSKKKKSPKKKSPSHPMTLRRTGQTSTPADLRRLANLMETMNTRSLFRTSITNRSKKRNKRMNSRR